MWKKASVTNTGNILILGCIKIVIRFYENNLWPLRAISLDKCCEVQRVLEHCANAIHHVQELFFF